MENKLTCLDKTVDWTIDRFEENIAILEHGITLETIAVNKKSLPQNIKAGQILTYIHNQWEINPYKTELRTQNISNLMEKIKLRNKI